VASVGIPSKLTVEILKQAFDKELSASPPEQVAYDLYAASFAVTTPDARFLTLMMAIETLAVQKDRSIDAINHVEKLIKYTKESGLNSADVQSITSALSFLKQQSIGQSCRDLAGKLAGLEYYGENPDTFMEKCYTLRSLLVHGTIPRPERKEVDLRAANLERMVGHLLSLKLDKQFR
jgi:hypothetical protein